MEARLAGCQANRYRANSGHLGSNSRKESKEVGADLHDKLAGSALIEMQVDASVASLACKQT